LAVSGRVSAYVMTAASLDARTVMINGREPKIGANAVFPQIASRRMRGALRLPAHSISFFAVTGIANPACAKP